MEYNFMKQTLFHLILMGSPVSISVLIVYCLGQWRQKVLL